MSATQQQNACAVRGAAQQQGPHLGSPDRVQARTHAQQSGQHPVHVGAHGVVIPGRRGRQQPPVQGGAGCGALHHKSGALAAVLYEVQVVVQLPSGLLPPDLSTPCMVCCIDAHKPSACCAADEHSL